MRRLLIYILPLAILSLAACDTFDDETPSFDRSVYTQDTVDVTKLTNTTIAEVKSRYASVISNSSYELVKEDLIFDAYVIGNDISGNLYQTLVLRKDDAGINIGINKTSLWVNFPVGTHVVVNLNGMYVGGYGKMAKIGIPYSNSNGNIRIGNITEALFNSNVKIVGFNAKAEEVKPVEVVSSAWLKNQDKDELAPTLIHMKNVVIKGYSNRLIFAKYTDSDASSGNGVNDILYFDGDQYTLRTSTLCDFASDTIPTDTVDIYGILTRYSSNWQIQLRSIDDIIRK